MTKRIFLSIALFLILSCGPVFAGGIEIREIGAKAGSTGGAFRAVADDGTSVFWNPAGLVQIKGQSVTAEASFIQVKAKVSQTSNTITGYKTGNVEQKKSWELVPTIAYTNSLNDKTKLGLGVYVQHGLGAEFDFFSDPVNFPAYPEYDWKSSGNFISIHPAVARQVNDRLSVGVGVFATRGSLEQRGPTVLPGAGGSFDSLLTGADIIIDSYLKGDGWGYGGNAGVLCKVNNEFTCALTYRSATSVKLSGDTQVDTYAASAGRIMTERSASSTKIALPANLGFGIAYRPEEKTTISFDADWTEWSSYDRFIIKNDNPTAASGGLITPINTSVNDWENTVRYSLGLNYRLKTNLDVCAGCYIDPSPVPDNTMTPWIADSGTKKAFSLSLNYKIKSMEFICGYEYMTAASRMVSGNPVDVDNDGVVDNLPGNYALKTGTIRLGANILF